MAHIRKKTHTRPVPANAKITTRKGKPVALWTDGKGRSRQAPVVTANGEPRIQLQSSRWYIDWTDARGKRRSQKGYSDRQATEQLAARLERRAAQKAEGLIDPFEEHARKPLVEHLADYRLELQSRGNAPRYVDLTLGRLASILTECRFEYTQDLDADRLSLYLASLRRSSESIDLPPGKEQFTIREASHLLSIGLLSISPLVRRHRLAATGQGKARRLPRETVQFLLEQRACGISVATTNQYLTAIKGFCNWLVRGRKIASNPFAYLESGNASVNIVHARRELSLDELHRVLEAARTSEKVFRGLSGLDRYHLYITACGTGFRASALACLTPDHFDLDGKISTVTMPVRKDKSRRGKVQPLPSDVADLLSVWLAGKPGRLQLWPGTWASCRVGADMLRIDLGTAGVPYVVDGPDGLLHADFHALRHTYLTLGGRAGIDLRTLQELAGHSTPNLTARYSHRRLEDLAGAVDRLQGLVQPVRLANERRAE